MIDSSKSEKAKCVNKNIVAKISHNEHKDVLLNTKCLRRSINLIQKNCKINEIFLCAFDTKSLFW